MDEVQQYEELRMSLAGNFEAQYNYLMVTGKLEEAYMTLGKLMAYKLIPYNDDRVDPKNRLFKTAGIEPNHRFMLDYRKDTRFIPEWLYADIPMRMACSVMTNKYWGKRVEGNYEGGIVYPERKIDIGIDLINTDKAAVNAAESIVKMSEEVGKKMNLAYMQAKASKGVIRIYEVTILSQVLSSYKTLGYIYLSKREDGVFVAKVLLKGKVMLDIRLPIGDTYKTIANTLRDYIHIDSALEVVAYSKHTKDKEIENNLLKRDDGKTADLEKLLDKEAKEKEAKATKKAEKEAEQAEREAERIRRKATVIR